MQHLGHTLDRLFPLLPVAMGFLITKWRNLRQRAVVGAAHNWPALSAKIEVVTAVEQLRESRHGDQTAGYLATLTYFYRNPDLQMGEYTRVFPLRTAAQSWAAQFKNRQVVVHVNPKDPAASVLLDADLEGITSCAVPSLDEALRMEKLPRLKPIDVILSGASEIIAYAGLALSATGLALSIRNGSIHWPIWLFWTGGAMIAFNLASGLIISFRTAGSRSFGAFRKVSLHWCPAWMRWGVKTSSALLAVLWFIWAISSELPTPVQGALARIVPHSLWLIACWGFLSEAAFHTAILRSQEFIGPAINDYPTASANESTGD